MHQKSHKTPPPLNHVCHMQNATRSVYNHFILKLCMSYISSGSSGTAATMWSCFSGAQKGLSSLQASDFLLHMYVIVAVDPAFLFLAVASHERGSWLLFFSSFSTCSVICVEDLFSHYLRFV